MNLRIASIDATPAMRIRVADVLSASFPGTKVDSFVPPDYLPAQNFDWSRFDAIIVGEFKDDEMVLPFVRGLALNPTRRPVIYLCDEEIDTPTAAALKLLAAVILHRGHFKDGELISAVMFARRDRGMLVAATSEPAPASGANVAPQARDPAPAPHIVLMDGSAGFRRLVANYLLSAWPAAKIEEIDPFSQTMRGAGIAFGAHGELLILGGIGTRSEALVALAKLGTLENRPPLIMLVTRELAPHLDEIRQGGAAALLFKESLSRNALRTAAASAIGLDKPSPDLPDAGNTGNFTFMRDGEQANLDIPGFRSIATISANPMAQVFFAERLYDRRRAVVKVLTASPLHDLKAIEAFCARYLFFSGLNGRNVVRYLDAGICGQWPYIALEHLASGDLRSRMQAPSPLQEQVQILSKLATALSTIHSGEFVHLDLKPENILFRENDELVLIDFNIATRFGGVGRSRDNDEVLGTPAYMSPEQGQGLPLDGRSDLYSAGVIFFEMLAGELPYLAKSDAEIIFRHIHDEIPLLPKRTRHLQVIIDGLMAKNRADRFSSGAELSLALQPFLAGTVNRPPPPSGN